MEPAPAVAAPARQSSLVAPFAALAALGAGIVFLWFAPTSYEVLKAIHVAAAVVWVGGATALTIIAFRTEREGDPHALASLGRQAEWLGQRVFTPASFVVLAFGIALVHKAGWGYGRFWVDFALAAWAASTALGVGLLVPKSKQLNALIAERGVEDDEVQQRLRQILAFARVDTLLLLLIVLDMAAKPMFS